MIPLHDSVPTSRRPILTIALIVANLAVFVWSQNTATQILLSNRGPVPVDGFTAVTAEYGFVPCELTMRCPHGDDNVDVGQFRDGAPAVVHVHHVPVLLTLVTSLFMHGGWAHVLGNMLFLWIFGNNIEDRVGRKRFLLFYLLGGIAAAALQLAAGPTSDVPNIGASGAIAAVLGGYPAALPDRRGDHLHPALLRVPAPGGVLPRGLVRAPDPRGERGAGRKRRRGRGLLRPHRRIRVRALHDPVVGAKDSAAAAGLLSQVQQSGCPTAPTAVDRGSRPVGPYDGASHPERRRAAWATFEFEKIARRKMDENLVVLVVKARW